MSCTDWRERLALHVEGDLPAALAAATGRHVDGCADCCESLEQLRSRQVLLKTLRHDTATSTDCRDVRRRVMTAVSGGATSGWALRLERAIVRALPRPALARAAFVAVGIVSATALAQRHPSPEPASAAVVFENASTLRRPDGYRDWILFGGSGTATHVDGRVEDSAHRVYMDPTAHRTFASTGVLPEGTVLIWEPAPGGRGRHGDPHGQPFVLLASVKDGTRFEGGWGFFDFSDGHGRTKAMAQPAPPSSGCRTCHLDGAEADPVFTGPSAGPRSPRQHS